MPKLRLSPLDNAARGCAGAPLPIQQRQAAERSLCLALSVIICTSARGQWAAFKTATIEYEQPQDMELTVNVAQAFPMGWRDLLLNDLEAPFQIPPGLGELSD